MKFISKNSKTRALNFKSEIDNEINNLDNMPYKFRKSIYFEDENIRDLIYKGYTIPYRINEIKNSIILIGIKKSQEHL